MNVTEIGPTATAERVGMLYRPRYLGDHLVDRRGVDFLEVCTDHYVDATPETDAELALLAAHFTLIPHGIDASVGSRDGLGDAYLAGVSRVVERVRPPWFSDHLAYTRAGGYEIGHLTPVPLTRDALATVTRNVARIAARTRVPFALENIAATFAFPHAELTHGAFLSELVARTGCGLVLDVANLACDEVNLGRSPEAFLDEIPRDAVVQVHFAGGHLAHGVYVDSHARPVPPRVWGLLERAIDACPQAWLTLEREEALPPYAAIVAELDGARALARRARTAANAT
ncbi:MAG: DUF692 domain-containing protein [Vulcanimicrobiaceae bacterium]